MLLLIILVCKIRESLTKKYPQSVILQIMGAKDGKLRNVKRIPLLVDLAYPVSVNPSFGLVG